MTSNVCTTCNAENCFVADQGYQTCTMCGSVQRRELNVNQTGYYGSTYHYPIKKPYTRINRFRKKIMGALQRRLNHDINHKVLRLLRQQFANKPKCSPEVFIDALTKIYTGKRKPYIYVPYYYEVVFKCKLPVIEKNEEERINAIFADIFYASKRLKLERPIFPMTTLLHLIVEHYEFSENTRYVARFGKKLRCMKRQRRYAQMFQKCIAYIKNAPSYHNTKKPSQEIYKKRKTPSSDITPTSITYITSRENRVARFSAPWCC